MAAKLLTVTIARVDGTVFEGEVISVVVPATGGVMEILADHQALISPLKDGEIRVKKADGSAELFKLERGTLEVSHNHATILI